MGWARVRLRGAEQQLRRERRHCRGGTRGKWHRDGEGRGRRRARLRPAARRARPGTRPQPTAMGRHSRVAARVGCVGRARRAGSLRVWPKLAQDPSTRWRPPVEISKVKTRPPTQNPRGPKSAEGAGGPQAAQEADVHNCEVARVPTPARPGQRAKKSPDPLTEWVRE